MDNTQQPHAVYQKSVIEFLTVANDYCLFIEKAHTYKREEIIHYVNNIAPLLYLKGNLLPEITTEFPEAGERYVTEENWEIIFNELRQIFGAEDEFWYINESFFIDSEITKGSIAEYLTDVYQDMKDFVMLYQRDSIEIQKNAVHIVKMLFKSHWGFKLIRILKNIHYLLYKDFYIEEDPGTGH